MKAAERRKAGTKLDHPGYQQLYHIHQVIELPVIRPEVTHWRLHQGRRLSCGKLCKATVPAEHGSGYSPRLTGFVEAMAGIVRVSRSAVQALCPSVCERPLSKGAIQKMVDRVSEAMVPYDDAIGEVARKVPVNSSDETVWLMHGDRHWLWVMANPEVTYFQLHPHRSKAACIQLLADWRGLLVSDDYLVYQRWQGLRQSCLAHSSVGRRGWLNISKPVSRTSVRGYTLHCNVCVI